MTESKTCILFGLSPDPKCLGLCEGLVDETELAVDEEKFRNSIRFTLGGLIAEGCDHILADAGCYALPYVENELKELSKQYIQNPITLEKLSLAPGDFMAMFRTADVFLIFDLDIDADLLSDFTSIFARHTAKHVLSVSSCGLMTNWNYT